VCAIGSLPRGLERCAAPPPLSENAREPTRSLHEPVRVTAVPQSRASCDAEFLLDPCYRARVEFKGPYTVMNTAGEYAVEVEGSCHKARPSGWAVVNNIKQGEEVRTLSSAYFNCVSTDEFEVRYVNLNPEGSSAQDPHKSVIVGVGFLGKPPPAGAARLIHHIHITRVSRTAHR
jgi:hypothetical protein